MEKSAIEIMADKLKNGINEVSNKGTSDSVERFMKNYTIKVLSIYEEEASRLCAEEKAKPTALASLVYELEKEKSLIDTTNYPEDFINGYDRAICDLKEILK